MNRKVRIQLVLAVTAAIGCLLLVLAARQIAVRHLTVGIPDPHDLGSALAHLRYQFRALGILGTIGAAVAGWVIGGHLMYPFERLRSELVAGNIAMVPQNITAGWSADAHALKHAALRHEANLQRRTLELARETEDLKQLLNAVSEGLMQIDIGSRILQTNPAALRLLGLPNQIIGQSLVSLVRHVELRQLILQAAAGESISGGEVTLDERRLLVSATPIPVENDSVAASAVIAIADLTQLRQLEGVRREFVANVSHELKTPLTSIRGYSETLVADESMPFETRKQFLEAIHRNSVRLQRIVDDLLDLSRIESGAWAPDLQEVSVTDVLHDVWIGCEDIAKKRGVTFVPPAAPVHVVADPHGLRQVFSNLFDNALRYTPPGGTIAVEVTESNGNGKTQMLTGLAVRDSGIGIPRESLGRIFERFYRVDPARSRAEGGTGLGLSIVKHIVDSMDGAVTAESEPGSGTTVTIWLPAS
jgi:signal transduction histidine kinase